MAMAMPQHSFVFLDDFIDFLQEPVNYLEKASGSNLGDWTDYGKNVNAGYNNYTIYWQWYKELGLGNLQAQPYCAGFVSVMFAAGFTHAKMKKLLCGNGYHYCPTGYNNFKAKGRIYSTPKKGDIVFFWGSAGRWSHTGIVIGVDSNGKGYTTIEANTSSGNDIVVPNGGATCRKHYTLGARKEAFGRPDYEGNGISLSSKPNYDRTYAVGTGANGLTVTATSLNIRRTPGTDGTSIGGYDKGSRIYPTKKAFVNGDAWFYVPDKDGWVSGRYLTGWILEYDDGNRWWWVLPGYTYWTNSIHEVDGNMYYFDDTGYMFTGTITFTTDENGVLKRS